MPPPDPRRSEALLIVDAQVDFCPGGALPVPDGDAVIPALNDAIEHARASGWPVYASRDWHPPDSRHFGAFGGRWPVHCVAESPGASFPARLRLPADAVIVSKGQSRADDGYSAFEGTTRTGEPLLDDLRRRGIARLYVGGLATDYCVRASVLDACKAGFEVTVLEDAVAGLEPGTTRQALEDMRTAGARVMSAGALDRDGIEP
jgi:nicotinamidase/pyrazinamidase